MNKAIGKFTQLCALASLASLQGCGGGVETNTDTSNIYVQKPVSDWEMIWSDEFDGSRIDSNKWTHEVNCLGGGMMKNNVIPTAVKIHILLMAF